MKGVSFVVCCHNSEQIIADCLQSIFNQRLAQNYPFEIILVDNCCTDATVVIACTVAQTNEKEIQIITETSPGLVNARRAGVQSATYDYICFVDDDNRLEPDYGQVGVRIFELMPNIGYIGGKTTLPKNTIPPTWLTKKILYSFAVGEQRDCSGYISDSNPTLWGAGLMFRRSILSSIYLRDIPLALSGRTKSSQFAGDDSELCMLAAIYGYRGYYEPNMRLVHAINPERFSMENLIRMYFGFGQAHPFLIVYSTFIKHQTSAPHIRSQIFNSNYFFLLSDLALYCLKFFSFFLVRAVAFKSEHLKLKSVFWLSATKSVVQNRTQIRSLHANLLKNYE